MSSSFFHFGKDVADGNHILPRFSVANAAGRGTSTITCTVRGVHAIIAADIGSLVRQEDNNTLWILASTGPAVWEEVGHAKSNRTAATSPGVNDDDSAGYAVTSLWCNTALNKVWVCVDASTGAANWVEIGSGGGANDKVGVSADDTTPDYLINKIAAGAGISITETTPGGDEDLTVAVDATASEITFVANGDIAATDVQAAVVEVRDDTDTKLLSKVAGPGGGSTDRAVAVFNGTGGQTINNSGVIIDASSNVSGVANLTQTGYVQLEDMTAPANPSAGQGRLYKKTGNDGIFWKPDAAGPEVDLTSSGSDVAVRVSSNDTTPGDLETKLIAGSGITMTTQNDGANETRTVAVKHAYTLQLGGRCQYSTTSQSWSYAYSTNYYVINSVVTGSTPDIDTPGVLVPRASTILDIKCSGVFQQTSSINELTVEFFKATPPDTGGAMSWTSLGSAVFDNVTGSVGASGGTSPYRKDATLTTTSVAEGDLITAVFTGTGSGHYVYSFTGTIFLRES